MEKPTVKENFIKKKKRNQQQSLNSHLLRKRNGRTNNFVEKKNTNLQKPTIRSH
jgi:hypothetical protein